ncbi:tyrosine-type recombinase/integrase [Paraburkholderia caledonica]|uniref:tyrosine-type recombinase/integrase n=1 Tax=Paraburkholderia caledonica TaxID=134536 RepID=UPI0003680E94|nr:tyrosine-type recombinase/integrase [Paraburkholderia caledonica]
MQSAGNGFASIVICPRSVFSDFPTACELARIPGAADIQPRLFELPAVAIIVDPKGIPVWMPTLYLADIALASHSVTGDTVRTYAEALLPWLEFLVHQGIQLSGVTEETIGLYRASIAHQNCKKSPWRYASATVNQRVVVPANFHAWGQRCTLMPSPLGAYLCTPRSVVESRVSSHRRVFHASRLQKIAAPRVIARTPMTLGVDELQQLFAVTSSPYRLMLRWCVSCGLRRFEVCSLQVRDLPSTAELGNFADGLARLTILRKGSKELTVHVPSRLVEETHWYVLTERPAPAANNGHFVFLNRRGGRISRQMLTREFRKSADAIGSKATLHHLRHTFALVVLSILQRHEEAGQELNPLKALQTLLGHAAIETTETYLRAAQLSSDAVRDALDYLYGASI